MKRAARCDSAFQRLVGVCLTIAGLAALAGGCDGTSQDADTLGDTTPMADVTAEPDVPPLAPGEVELAAAAPTMQRLTRSQYTRSIHQALGAHIVVPQILEPDVVADGSQAIGSGLATISPRGAEQYEVAAFQVAAQALDADHRAALVPCTPQAATGRDDTCAQAALAPLVRLLWRRALSEAEVAELVSVAGTGAETLGDFWEGMEFGLAVALQAPAFLFRMEVGEADPDRPGLRRRTATELATRLAFTLWDGPPDAALLQAAESGALTTEAGLDAELDRMLGSPKLRQGLRAFATDWLELHDMGEVQKDPTIFLHLSPELVAAASEETLLGFERLVLELDGDFRTLFTTRETFVDRTLAALYDISAPGPDGLSLTTLPEDGTRRGLLGQASFLALRSHPTSSSATLRGKFIRERLLCGYVPIPPVNLSTGLPPVTEQAKTRRQRSEQHNTDPGCSGCHFLMDPMGLGLERFDGLGRLRWTENGEVIDPSGDVDGTWFGDAAGLAELLAEHPDVPRCFVQNVYQYVLGREWTSEEFELLGSLTYTFAQDGHRVKGLLKQICSSPGFRQLGAPATEAPQTEVVP